ncbi:MAG: AfsR/SARP family transcriptional regulator, partial [Gammaproteobacteria bacterium]
TEVPENRLIDELWPDSDGDIGRSAFSTTVKRLRQLIGADALSVGDGRVSLDRRRCWTDVWAFEYELDRAEAAERSGDTESFMVCAEDAVALYQGHFLANDQDAWILATRERLRNRLLALIGKAGCRLEDDGRWRQAANWYRRGLELDPLAEEFYQGLMRAYLKLGCRAEVVRAYRACQAALVQGLGIAPCSATEKLYRQLTGN